MNVISFFGRISPDDSTFIGVALIVCAIIVLFTIYMDILERESSKKRTVILCSLFSILVVFGIFIPSVSLSCNCADENTEAKTIIIKDKFTEGKKYYFYDTANNKYLMRGDEVVFRHAKIQLNEKYAISVNYVAGNLSCEEVKK